MNEGYALVPFNTALNKEQISIIDRPYNENGFRRAIAYAKENPKIIKELCQVDIENMPLPVIAAGGLASIGTTCILNFDRKLAKTNHSSSLLKSTAYALAAFESIVICYNLKEIQSSTHYVTWKKHRVKMMKNQFRKDFFEKDNILQHLLCPISGTIPDIPATIDHCQWGYDYGSAVDWIKKNPGQPLPRSTVVTRIEELKFDSAHVNTVVERLIGLKGVLHYGETRRLVYAILGVDSTLRHGPLEELLVIIHLIADNGIATITEMFSRAPDDNRESLLYLHKLKQDCLVKEIGAKHKRWENYTRERKPIRCLPQTTEQERFIYDNKIIQLALKVSSIKYVRKVVTNDSIVVNFVKFFFNIQPEFIITREPFDWLPKEPIQNKDEDM